MKKLLLLLVFLPVLAWSAEVSTVVNSLVDQLAADYTKEAAEPFYSRQAVSIIEIRNTTKEMEDNYIGQGVEELLKNALADSLIFRLVDRKNLDAAMKEVKLSLTGLTEGKDAPVLGKIKNVKLLLDGSVTADGDTIVLNLRLTDVETTEVVAAVSAALPKAALITESSRIAYEYVMANGIGLSLFITPLRYLILNRSEPKAVGDDKIHAGTGGGSLTYRLDKNWKISINADINMKDVFYDLRTIGTMKNLTAYDNVFDTANLTINGFWEKDGSFTNDSSVKSTLAAMGNYYALSQETTTVSFVLSRVFSFGQKLNVSAGIGPHVNFLRYTEVYDNVPILINEGIAFKRYEVVMDFLGLGGTAEINIEYFVLPRFALNLGISGFYSYIFPKSGDNMNARSTTSGEWYYGSSDFSLESFGLNPFMMPDGRMITADIYAPDYLKLQLGASVYF